MAPSLWAQEAAHRIDEKEDRLTLLAGPSTLAVYRFGEDLGKPVFQPVTGPSGAPVTRNWPLGEPAEGEARDHVHHKGLWYSHGDVNGVDFWGENENHGSIRHLRFTTKAANQDGTFVIASDNAWTDAAGKTLMTDARRVVFRPLEHGETMIDFSVTLFASHGKVTLGDTKEGTMAFRLAPTLRLKGDVATGRILNSEGVEGKGTWGKRAAWCDYQGKDANGKVVGVLMLDHPGNPRHPTWWHVRDYGLFAANPFGQRYFESLKDKTAGNLELADGESAAFHYRFYLHREIDSAEALQARFSNFSKQTAPKLEKPADQ